VSEALVDTDILSFYFKGDTKVVASFRNYLNKFEVINTSIITYYEIISGLKYKQAELQLRQFYDFVMANSIIHISEESAKISGDIYSNLRKKGIVVGTSDILIAGIAMENDLTLITNNEKHFKQISGLKIENWKL